MSDLDAAVEAAAKESWSQLTGDHGRKWADLPGATRHALHSQARPLIEAAAPHIAAQVLQDAADGQDDSDVALYLLNLADGHAGCEECRADAIEEGR